MILSLKQFHAQDVMDDLGLVYLPEYYIPAITIVLDVSILDLVLFLQDYNDD
jgi:membrane-bound acyltransferase YfiQ involved in biofilm formation